MNMLLKRFQSNIYQIFNSLTLSRHITHSYHDIVLRKGKDTKLSESKFWDVQYSKEDKNSATEWYVNSQKAANFVNEVLLQRELLHPTRLNILVEIGCGTKPLLLPFINLHKSGVKVLCCVTDVSNVCISKLREYYNDDVRSKPRRTRLRGDNKTFIFLRSGVMCSVLDIKDFSTFCEELRYFSIRDIAHYKDYVNFSEIDEYNYRTNIIAIDKGCIDALVWDKRTDLVRNVLENSDSILSISGEDPDIRLDYFQTQFDKLFSVHFLRGSEIFGYSYVSKVGMQ